MSFAEPVPNSERPSLGSLAGWSFWITWQRPSLASYQLLEFHSWQAYKDCLRMRVLDPELSPYDWGVLERFIQLSSILDQPTQFFIVLSLYHRWHAGSYLSQEVSGWWAVYSLSCMCSFFSWILAFSPQQLYVIELWGARPSKAQCSSWPRAISHFGDKLLLMLVEAPCSVL